MNPLVLLTQCGLGSVSAALLLTKHRRQSPPPPFTFPLRGQSVNPLVLLTQCGLGSVSADESRQTFSAE